MKIFNQVREKSVMALINNDELASVIKDKIKPIFAYVGIIENGGGIHVQINDLYKVPEFKKHNETNTDLIGLTQSIISETKEVRERILNIERVLNKLEQINNQKQRKNLYDDIKKSIGQILLFARQINDSSRKLKQELKNNEIVSSPAENICEFAKSILRILV